MVVPNTVPCESCGTPTRYWGLAVPRYHFAMIDGKRIEAEPGEIFPDDARALAYGRQVVREVTHGDHARFKGWAMEVTQGTRVVGTILCELDGLAAEEKQARPGTARV